ncbi:MAG: hypothetical protein DCC75_03250 [Proteobacteria bacterium]|nr:MAG: hypothetical protein DCC75_03250 [Pseudomonadota bacterium]
MIIRAIIFTLAYLQFAGALHAQDCSDLSMRQMALSEVRLKAEIAVLKKAAKGCKATSQSKSQSCKKVLKQLKVKGDKLKILTENKEVCQSIPAVRRTLPAGPGVVDPAPSTTRTPVQSPTISPSVNPSVPPPPPTRTATVQPSISPTRATPPPPTIIATRTATARPSISPTQPTPPPPTLSVTRTATPRPSISPAQPTLPPPAITATRTPAPAGGNSPGLQACTARPTPRFDFGRVKYNPQRHLASSSAIADLNGDGRADLILNSSQSSSEDEQLWVRSDFLTASSVTAGLLLGNGAITKVLPAKLNPDGLDDLIALHRENARISVVHSQGGALQLMQTLQAGSIGSEPVLFLNDLAAADLDGDQDADIAAVGALKEAGGFGVLVVFRNNGQGVFAGPEHYMLSRDNPISVIIKELNGDAFREIIIAHYGSGDLSKAVSIIPNSSGSMVGTHVVIDTAGGVGALAAGDVTGDNLSDLVIATHLPYRLLVLKNNGSLNFEQLRSFSFGSGIIQILLDDIDQRDGLDIISLLSGNSPRLSVRLNDSTQSFARQYPFAADNEEQLDYQVLAHDYDNDTDKDLFILTSHTADPTTSPPKPGLKRIPVQASLDCNQNHISDYYEVSQDLAPDCNCNGLPDSCDLSLSNTALAEERTSFSSLGLRDLAVMDLNLDGRTDLVPTSVDFLLSEGDGAFRNATSGLPYPIINSSASKLTLRDLNSDGMKDLIVLGSDPYPSKFLSFLNLGNGVLNPNGTWVAPAQRGSATQRSPARSELLDYDGDGDMDLLSMSLTSNNLGNIAEVFMNDGNSNFTRIGASFQHDFPTYPGASSLSIGRINNDNREDVLTVEDNFGWRTLVSSNSGFQERMNALRPPLPQFPLYPATNRLKDFDGDGLDDVLAYSTSQHKLHLVKNMGDGTFQIRYTISVNSQISDALLEDINNDGVLELFILEKDPAAVRMYRIGQGGQLLAASPLMLPSSPADKSASKVRIGDFNGDGILDLLAVVSPFPSSAADIFTYLGPVIPYSLDTDGNSIPDECQGP